MVLLIFVGLDKKGISGSGVSVRIPGSRLEGGFSEGCEGLLGPEAVSCHRG